MLALLVLLLAAAMAQEEEDDSPIQSIADSVGSLAILLVTVGLFVVGVCTFLVVMWHRRSNQGRNIGPLQIPQV